MTWILKHKLFAIAAAIVAYFLLRKAAKAAATPPAVVDTVTSGSKWKDFDLNILSPTFGDPVEGPVEDEGSSGWFW